MTIGTNAIGGIGRKIWNSGGGGVGQQARDNGELAGENTEQDAERAAYDESRGDAKEAGQQIAKELSASYPLKHGRSNHRRRWKQHHVDGPGTGDQFPEPNEQGKRKRPDQNIEAAKPN
ncbi:hypothetical protein ACVWXL_004422 [Bradyrhizobium sp. GM22.5]